MAFVIEEIYLPATLTAPHMTDEQFVEFCAEHPDYLIETTAEGEILIMPPNFPWTSAVNGQVFIQLEMWNQRVRRGVATEASGGFVLPNGARRAPDAAWTAKARLAELGSGVRGSFWHLCPDFAIEVRSQSDRLPVLRRKMQEWIDSGAKLGWLIDPERRAVEIYRPGREPEVRLEASSVEGEGPVEGFCLRLDSVWNPLGA